MQAFREEEEKMGSFTKLSNPNIPSYSLYGSSLQLRSSSFSNLRHPLAVNTCFNKTRPKGVVGALKVIRPEAMIKEYPVPMVVDEEEEIRIQSLVREIKELFASLGDGEMSPSPYDTAWVARIPSVDDPKKPQFPTTLQWILKNQLTDGSWGEPEFFFLYERLACTLSCVLTLTLWRQGDELIAKGLHFLQNHIPNLEKEKSNSRLVGFEVTFPSMLKEAQSLGLSLPYELPCLKHIFTLREEKKRRIPVEVMHSVHTTLLHSLEAFQELVQWDKILKLQSSNGSFADSPSSTVAAYLNSHDKKCLEYLTNIVKKFEDHVPNMYPLNIFERNWMVDTIQRLGIDHHFHEEIFNTLDYLYRNLRKDGMAWETDHYMTDIDDTCITMLLLRLHGYPVSSDMLEYFKYDDENFMCFAGETHKGVSEILSVYRVSQIAFPGEKILKQAKAFAKQHLTNAIRDNQVHDKWAIKKALNKEIEWELKTPWKICLPRLAAQEYIRNYGDNDVWIGKSLIRMYNINNSKYLELAKLDYNKLHAMHTGEANSILTWWNSYNFDDHLVTQFNPREIHFSICTVIYEPEFSSARIAYTKCNCIENILKAVFQSHESIEELKIFSQALTEWKPSMVQVLTPALQLAFMVAYDTINELANEAKNAQGNDVFDYLLDLRKLQVQKYLKMREFKDAKQFSSLEEYVEQYKRGLAVTSRLLPSMLLMGDLLLNKAFKSLDNISKIEEKLTLYLALLNLMTEEKTEIFSYMKKQYCSKQEVSNYIEEKIEDAFTELTHEYLKPSYHVPKSCRRLIFEHGRITRFYLDKVGNDQFAASIESLYNQVS